MGSLRSMSGVNENRAWARLDFDLAYKAIETGLVAILAELVSACKPAPYSVVMLQRCTSRVVHIDRQHARINACTRPTRGRLEVLQAGSERVRPVAAVPSPSRRVLTSLPGLAPVIGNLVGRVGLEPTTKGL